MVRNNVVTLQWDCRLITPAADQEDKATTDGKWHSKTKLSSFRLTIATDGKHLTVYRDGMIDMKILY